MKKIHDVVNDMSTIARSRFHHVFMQNFCLALLVLQFTSAGLISKLNAHFASCSQPNLHDLPRPIIVDQLGTNSKLFKCLSSADIEEITFGHIKEIWYLGEDAEANRRIDDGLYAGGHIKFRYKILSFLGKGHHGLVIKARDMKDGTAVAIKIAPHSHDAETRNEYRKLLQVHRYQLPGSEFI